MARELQNASGAVRARFRHSSALRAARTVLRGSRRALVGGPIAPRATQGGTVARVLQNALSATRVGTVLL